MLNVIPELHELWGIKIIKLSFGNDHPATVIDANSTFWTAEKCLDRSDDYNYTCHMFLDTL